MKRNLPSRNGDDAPRGSGRIKNAEAETCTTLDCATRCGVNLCWWTPEVEGSLDSAGRCSCEHDTT